MPAIRTAIGIALLSILIIGCDDYQATQNKTSSTRPNTVSTTPPLITPTAKQDTPARYAGSDNCKLCHLNQHNEWQTSDHHQAMAPASEKTVLGQFPAKLAHHQQQTTFSSANGQYHINTDTGTESAATLPLKYSFGIYPLQQYLTELQDGTLQSLPFAWDSRNKEAGGQKWFHLYPDENIFPGDALHWRANSHNANHMCIECHSTDFQKNADFQKNTAGQDGTPRFSSTWKEMGVGCESCHGPASNHLAWSSSPDKSHFSNKGWDFTLTSGSPSLWQPQVSGAKPHRTTPADNYQLEQCAQCHSRRSRIDASNHSGSFFNSFLPSLLDASLYHPDGQILDEVYEYGSFTQSKMHSAGVTCSNCHNPHSGKVRIEGNGLCLQCHDANHDTPAHTLHPTNSPGSACVACHMPTTTYMQVDPRRDHSFRIPRPDLTASTGAPYACQQCHENRTTEWAIQTLAEHFGKAKDSNPPHYGSVFALAQRSEPAAFEDLVAITSDLRYPVMVRATAASLLGRFPTRDPRAALSTAMGSTEPLIRLGALQACESLPPNERLVIFPLLTDKLKAVRIEAARLASVIPDVQQIPGYTAARDEYVASLQLNSDRAAALVSLASLAATEQRWHDAENLLLKAIALEPWYIPASVNLADVYRSQQRESDAEAILKKALAVVPDNAELQLSYGLLLVRGKQMTVALAILGKAAKNSPDPYAGYVYALALRESGNPQEARKILDDAAKRAYSRDVQLARLESAWNENDKEMSRRYLSEWLEHDSQDPAALHWQKAMMPDRK